jgi:peptidoglycan/LPS O-acetylase OafA/YrhL
MPEVRFQQLTETRRNNLDFLRFVFASLVVFTHSFNILARVEDEPVVRLTSGQFAAATIAVNAFFVISGFLIAASWMRCKGLGDYLKKRALRIYPGFIVVVLFAVLFAGLMGTDNRSTYLHDHRTYSFIYRQLLFRPDPCLYHTFAQSHTPSLPLGSLATLRYEVGCYLLIPVLAWCGLFRRRAGVLILFASTLALYMFLEMHHIAPGGPYPFRLLTYFLAGVTFYLYQDHIPYSRLGLVVSLLTLVATLKLGMIATLPIAGTYILFYIAYNPTIKLQNFGRKGDISYGIFLYGYLVQQIIAGWFSFHLAPPMLTLLALPVTYLFAAVSWHFVEKPFLRKKVEPKDNSVLAVVVDRPQNSILVQTVQEANIT